MPHKMMNYGYSLTLILLSMLTMSCRYKPDLEAEKQKLLALHQEQQDAHLNENARQLVDQGAENAISINRGKISRAAKDSTILRFESYFGKIEHKKWEDLKPPEIHFSEDGSMAYMVVDKLVVITYTNDKGDPIEETTHFAWVNIFRKQADGQWKSVCVASTNEPSVEKKLNPSKTPVPDAGPASQ